MVRTTKVLGGGVMKCEDCPCTYESCSCKMDGNKCAYEEESEE